MISEEENMSMILKALDIGASRSFLRTIRWRRIARKNEDTISNVNTTPNLYEAI
jgi:hypothetical protein